VSGGINNNCGGQRDYRIPEVDLTVMGSPTPRTRAKTGSDARTLELVHDPRLCVQEELPPAVALAGGSRRSDAARESLG
jgi:hypothetical protein